jgi:hypothetical protein
LSRAIKFFDIKKAPKYSRLDVGVDPDAIGRTPDPLLISFIYWAEDIKKSPEFLQDLKWELIP